MNNRKEGRKGRRAAMMLPDEEAGEAGAIGRAKEELDEPFASTQSRGMPRFLARTSVLPSQTGGLFLAVNRGKLSEGIDFADYQARAVIVVGIPFPSVKDPQVVLKRAHNDHQRKAVNESILTGNQWYSLQAYRTVNQALGRTIRHRWDYGAIFLVDERYLDAKVQASLSRWVQPSLTQVPLSFQAIMDQTSEFFTKWTANPPAPPTGPPAAAPSSSAGPDYDPRDFAPGDPGQRMVSSFFTAASLLSPQPAAAAGGGGGGTGMKSEPIDLLDELDLPVTFASRLDRARVEVAYEQEGDASNRRRVSAASASRPAGPSARSASAAAAATSLTSPSHLALACRKCGHGLADLPILQAVNAPPYRQQITTSYFTQTVGSAMQSLSTHGACAVRLTAPSSVGALVCSVSSLEPSASSGGYGWLGYPVALPAEMPSQPFLASQFYNLWCESDQVCYQPLCCAQCRSFVGCQILADRSPEFEEACWIANELIQVKPTNKNAGALKTMPLTEEKPCLPATLKSESDGVVASSMDVDPPQQLSLAHVIPPFASPKPKAARAVTPQLNSLMDSPNSLPALEDPREMAASRAVRSPFTAGALIGEPSPPMRFAGAPPPTANGKKRGSALLAIRAAAAGASSSGLISAPLAVSSLGGLPNESADRVSPPAKKSRNLLETRSTDSKAKSPSTAAATSSQAARETIDVDAMEDDFLCTPGETKQPTEAPPSPTHAPTPRSPAPAPASAAAHPPSIAVLHTTKVPRTKTFTKKNVRARGFV